MRYTLRRIVPSSAIRVGLTVGWLVALCPALCIAALAVSLFRQIDATLGQVTPIQISFFGQEIARLDLLEILQLRAPVDTASDLAANTTLTILLLTALLVLAITLLIVAVLLLFTFGYNLIAALGGGLRVELTGEEPRREA